MSIFTRIFVYYGTYAAGFALMLILSLIRCGLYGISRARAAVYSFITFLSGFCGALIIGAVYNTLFSLKGIETDVRVDVVGAVIFTSLFLLAAVYIEKYFLKKRAAKTENEEEPRTVSFRDTMDLVIPGSFFVFACIKSGCSIRGCCYGIVWEHGVRSPMADVRLFPVQICESLTLCAIVIAGCLMMRAPFYRRGMAGPLFANMYGVARFGWEFLRFYTPEMRRFAAGLTLWQILSVLIIIVSTVWLAILFRTQPPEPLRKNRVSSKTGKETSPSKKNVGGGKPKAANKKRSKKKKK